MQSATVAPTRIPREKLLQIARSLPADLSVLSELGEILQDVNSDLSQIATLLRRDLALAARIVRISNSTAYGGNGEIASIEEAVNRVDFGEVLKLVGSGAASRFSDQATEAYGISAEEFRGNMIFGAFAAEAVARAARIDMRVAYTAGLVRPLGIMVLDRAWNQIEKISSFDPSRWTTYSAWEESVFGLSHVAATGTILEEWRFPQEIRDGVAAHYLEQAKDHESQIAVILNLANALALKAGRSLSGENAWWEVTPLKLEALGIDEATLEEAGTTAEEATLNALSAFSD